MALSERFLVLTLTAILIGMISAPGIPHPEPLEPTASEMSVGTRAGTTEWTAVAGYPSSPPTTPSIGVAAGYISPTSVEVDTLGNVYTGGFVIYDVSFGSQAYSDVEQMAYVAKASSTGTWQKLYYTGVFDGGGSATVTAITTSGTDVYACGWFVGNVTIGPQSFQSYTPSGSVESSQDIWVAKFDQNLNPLWAKQAGTVENDDACEDIVVSPTNPDGSKDVYIIGETNATAQAYFGTSITRNGNGGTSTDIFIAKMSASNGAWDDAKITGGQSQDLGQSIAWRGGGIVATGLFSGTANFGSQQMQAIGSYDLWIADAGTNLAWANASQAGGTAGVAQPFGIVHQSGVDYIAGTVRGTVNFDTNQVMSSSNGQDTTTFVASRSGTNNQWDWITTASGYHEVRDIDISSEGVLLVTGSFATVSWSGTGGSLQQSGSGTWGTTTLSSTYFDPFHATMDSSGNWVSADAGSGDYNDNGIGGVWSPNGQIIGMGTFGSGGPTNIGSTYTLTLGSSSVIGNGNAFTDQNYQIYVQIGAYIWSLKSDSDSDGTPDVDDNCPDLFNPSQSDIDGDTLGDECDPDADDDGLLNENDNCDGPETNWDPTDITLDRDQDGCKDATEDTDDDADGIDDLTDACDDIGDKMGWVSNNVYDHDQDGCHDIDEDDDDDNDYVQDTVDLCPRGWFNWSTSATTDHDGDGCHDEGEDDDDDNDGMFDMTLDEQPLDKCPKGDLGWISDATTDRDSDGCRDEGEDTDDDDDTVPDDDDKCTPDGDLDWTSVTMVDHDGDGCRDATEDDDDDDDSILDVNDSCPTGLTGWTSTVLLDVDGDGCQDNAEDTDNDNDGVANALDGCPSGETGWFASNTLDADGDGCRDDTEDTDDDADGVLDENDACPNTPLGEAADPAGCGYNTQQDNDGDGIYDINDACLNTPSESTRLFGKTLTSEANGLVYEWGTEIEASTGCWFGELDRDGDGVKNYLDQCPDTNTGSFIDEFGCAAEEYDWDKDGIIGDVVLNPDICPGTSDATTRDNHTEFGGIDGFGCWAGDSDTDSDQVLAYMDMCPDTDEFAAVSKDLESPEIMGCADNQLDFDNDGITNDLDICPDTPTEIEVQIEGERIGCSLEQRAELGDIDALAQKNILIIVIATLVLVALLGGVGFVLTRGGNSSQSGVEMMMAQQAAPMMHAAAPPIPAPPGFAPAQPTHVADYTGLPGGGHYDQGYDGSTIYIAPDATQWQMNADGSFTRV